MINMWTIIEFQKGHEMSFPGELLQVPVLQGTVFDCQELARPHEIGDTLNG